MKSLPYHRSLLIEHLEPQMVLSSYNPLVDSNLGFNIIGFYEQGPEGATDWSDAILEMHDLGVNDVTLVVYRQLDENEGTFVASSGPRLDHVEAGLVTAKQLGMNVTLSTIFETMAGWRGDWDPTGTRRQSFYADYTDLAMDLANLAEQHGAERLTFASELEQFMRNSGHASYLDGLISDIDAVFSGDIGYGSTAVNLQDPTLKSMVWDHPKIDYVAISAYYTNYFADTALADASSSMPEAELLSHFESKWNDLFDNEYLPYVQSLRGGEGMPFFIQEFGAVPFNRTSVATWSIAPGAYTGANSEVPDAQEQKVLYESLINTTAGRGDQISNVFFWTWAFGGNDADLFGINPNLPLASQPTGDLIAETLIPPSHSVTINGTTATIVGTNRDDTFVWKADDETGNPMVWVNGNVVSLPSSIEQITFDGLEGDDMMRVTTGATDDRAALYPDSVVVTTPDVRIRATYVESVFVDGGDGDDLATLSGSDGDDVYVGREDSVRLTGDGYSFRVDSFERTNVYGNAGQNFATFYDSEKHDRFTSSEDRTTMRDLRFLYQNSTFGFDIVYAESGKGGQDYAFLFDRETNDHLISEPDRTRLESLTGEFSAQVSGFAQVYSYSTAGGDDVATLTDRDGEKDQFIARPTDVRFQAKNKVLYNVATGFETVYAYATPEDGDQAFIFDSPGDDTLVAKPLNVTFSASNGVSQRFIDFQRTTTQATDGNDTVIFHDSALDDRFVAKPQFVSMRAANGDYINRVSGFDGVQAFATAGFDTSYMYDSHRVDTVTMNRDVTRMEDLLETYMFESRGFERSYVYGGTSSQDVGTATAKTGSEKIVTVNNTISVRSLDGEFFGRLTDFAHTTIVVIP